MRNGLLLLAGLGMMLAGCSFEMPSFVGRGGGDAGAYQLGGEAAPAPRSVALRDAALERALHGMILRVVGEAPTQGFYSAELRPLGGGSPDAAGILSFELVARPPVAPGAVGPARTRVVSAAVFVPNLALKDLRGFRVAGAGTVQTLPVR